MKPVIFGQRDVATLRQIETGLTAGSEPTAIKGTPSRSAA